MKHKLVGTAVAIGSLAACVSLRALGRLHALIDGVVFTVDANEGHAVIPMEKYWLDGSTHIEAESDGVGKFAFGAVPPGRTRSMHKHPAWPRIGSSRLRRIRIRNSLGNESPSRCGVDHGHG